MGPATLAVMHPLAKGPVRVLLVEDDEGDAMLVAEMLEDADESYELTRARSIRETLPLLIDGIQCVLVDLGLPDAEGLEAVELILKSAPGAALVVLTGLADKSRGLEAVAAGAQDYLVKGEVDGLLLGRAIRYAVQRRGADESSRQLLEAALYRGENARLMRGLLPRPLISDPALSHATRYRPSGRIAVVGGDYLDAVERPDGSVRAMIGDVSGHGPEEAALGVAMRVGWRALVVGGVPEEDVLPALNILCSQERAGDETFATMCDLTLAPDRTGARVRLAGHPPPLLFGGRLRFLTEVRPGPPLGIGDDPSWPAMDVELGSSWALFLYTDGLFEGRVLSGDRLGLEGLLEVAEGLSVGSAGIDDYLDRLLDHVESMNGGLLPDDVAMLALSPASKTWA